jgi:O-antigen biosynthesis protein
MYSYLYRILPEADRSLIAQLTLPNCHADCLTTLAARALGIQAYAVGVWLLERRCRITPPARPIDCSLFADLLYRTGYKTDARAAIEQALRIDPDDRVANRLHLLRGTPEQSLDAARQLSAHEDTPAILVEALQRLAADGVTRVGQARTIDGAIEGWVAWTGLEPLKLTIEDHTVVHQRDLARDPQHPLTTGLGSAAAISVAKPDRPPGWRVGHWSGTERGARVLSLRCQFSSFSEPKPEPIVVYAKRLPRAHPPAVTVIVPVYRDLPATSACLSSLIAAAADDETDARILVVNDASPEPGMVDYLSSLPIDIITHQTNRGFVDAVNTALGQAPIGDVLLLNADTIVPPRIIGRLRQIAHAAPGIGTVTPLSNNGELTSLPRPFRENPLPDHAEILAIDRAANTLHDSQVIDIPSGIGFCMYITRACLDAVGPLSKHYERGYCEDVHFSLTAAALGFRNVCALSVYVGHVGTRSFLAEKRRLVVQNTRRITARFPNHDAEIDAFVAADPLADARHAIGRRLIDGFAGRLVIAGPGSAAQATEHAISMSKARIRTAGSDVLLLVANRTRLTLHLFGRGGELAAETIVSPADGRRVLHQLHPDRIDVFDPQAFVALEQADELPETTSPIELHVVDASALAGRDGPLSRAARAAWALVVARAKAIHAPTNAALTFFGDAFPETAALACGPTIDTRPQRPAPTTQPVHQLGVVLLHETAACRRLIRALGQGLTRNSLGAPPVVVLGRTSIDLVLMRAGGVMITGNIDATELAAVSQRMGVSHLLVLSSGPHFGAPLERAALATGLPLASFHWSAIDPARPTYDCSLDPHLPDQAIVDALDLWLTGTLE